MKTNESGAAQPALVALVALPTREQRSRTTLAEAQMSGESAELRDPESGASVRLTAAHTPGRPIRAETAGKAGRRRLQLRVRATRSTSVRLDGPLAIDLWMTAEASDEVTAVHRGSGRGDCEIAVRGAGDNARAKGKLAVRSGDGDGSARCDGPGPGRAERNGTGAGDAVRTDGAGGSVKKARGDARRGGAGAGSAIAIIGGAGHAVRTGEGDGDALRRGDGDGNAVRAGGGAGDAVRTGGTGRSGGIARRSGNGAGDAVCESPRRGDAIRNGTGEGDAIRRRRPEDANGTDARGHAWRLNGGRGHASLGAGVNGWAVATGAGDNRAHNLDNAEQQWTGPDLSASEGDGGDEAAGALTCAPDVVREAYAAGAFARGAAQRIAEAAERISHGADEETVRRELGFEGFLVEVGKDGTSRLSGAATGPDGANVTAEAAEGGSGFRTRGLSNAALAAAGTTRDRLRETMAGYRRRIESRRREQMLRAREKADDRPARSADRGQNDGEQERAHRGRVPGAAGRSTA